MIPSSLCYVPPFVAILGSTTPRVLKPEPTAPTHSRFQDPLHTQFSNQVDPHPRIPGQLDNDQLGRWVPCRLLYNEILFLLNSFNSTFPLATRGFLGGRYSNCIIVLLRRVLYIDSQCTSALISCTKHVHPFTHLTAMK